MCVGDREGGNVCVLLCVLHVPAWACVCVSVSVDVCRYFVVWYNLNVCVCVMCVLKKKKGNAEEDMFVCVYFCVIMLFFSAD